MYVQTVLFYSIILFITFSLKFGLDFLCSYKFNLLSHSHLCTEQLLYISALFKLLRESVDKSAVRHKNPNGIVYLQYFVIKVFCFS